MNHVLGFQHAALGRSFSKDLEAHWDPSSHVPLACCILFVFWDLDSWGSQNCPWPKVTLRVNFQDDILTKYLANHRLYCHYSYAALGCNLGDDADWKSFQEHATTSHVIVKLYRCGWFPVKSLKLAILGRQRLSALSVKNLSAMFWFGSCPTKYMYIYIYTHIDVARWRYISNPCKMKWMVASLQTLTSFKEGTSL